MFRALLSIAAVAAFAIAQPRPSWTNPGPPHTIAGNLHYIGTEDLACFLITTPQGHILINTGLADSVPMMRKSAESLGFKLTDVKILLTMQAHFDHTAAMAEIQKLSGAKVFATEADALLLEDGGKSDLILKSNRFAPVKVDRRLKDGDVISLGRAELIVHLTPGHTKGSVTYSMNLMDKGVLRRVLIANMNTVVMPLVNNAWYPNIVADYEKAFRVQKALAADIWVAAHASQYAMQEKLKAGSFVDPEGYRRAVDRYEQEFRQQLAKERK
jgi:metallo-beta-lactamase class B